MRVPHDAYLSNSSAGGASLLSRGKFNGKSQDFVEEVHHWQCLSICLVKGFLSFPSGNQTWFWFAEKKRII